MSKKQSDLEAEAEKGALKDTEGKEAKMEETEKVFALLITSVQKEAEKETEVEEEETGQTER